MHGVSRVQKQSLHTHLNKNYTYMQVSNGTSIIKDTKDIETLAAFF